MAGLSMLVAIWFLGETIILSRDIKVHWRQHPTHLFPAWQRYTALACVLGVWTFMSGLVVLMLRAGW